ncbi:arginase family protein [Acetobacter sp. DsW_059]|uniref:arginase family protein n=1 Tax=Acetobacter sp. DsW_059 TaxID=1670661 RepID=UPI000A3AE98B|nr:arginase family protein [Acetobacter sp. DsW_059]OUJ10478.1 arginase [Acetobacter sp. DsW_059]
MTLSSDKTLRLLFPQWQGGNNLPYFFGAQLLSWLAPVTNGPVEEVPVKAPTEKPLSEENGIVGRQVLLEQLHTARGLIDKHNPDRLVVLGGDCLVDLAPFAYLSERYKDELAVLWVDTHPDIMTPEHFNHAHAMVLGNLLGLGDADFTQAVAYPVKPENVLFAGLHDPTEWEAGEIKRLGLKNAGPEELAQKGSKPVLDWFRSTGAKYLAIHLDLDVFNPRFFHSVLFAQPNVPPDTFKGIAQGEVSMAQVIQLLDDISEIADVVGLGIAEHMPWDALALKNMLARLPLIGHTKL